MENTNIWLRLAYMIFFGFTLYISLAVMWIVAVFQFFTVLFASTPNKQLLEISNPLAAYVHQIIGFLTFKRDQPPYPFGEWPKGAELNEGTVIDITPVADSGNNNSPAQQPKDD